MKLLWLLFLSIPTISRAIAISETSKVSYFEILVLDAISGRPEANTKITFFCEAPRTPSTSVFTDGSGLTHVPFYCSQGTKIQFTIYPRIQKEQCGGNPSLTLEEILSKGVVSSPVSDGGLFCSSTKFIKRLVPVPGRVVVFVKKPSWWQSHIAE